MLKLIIVDDEVFVRRGLKNSINWTSIGYEVIADAEDGEKALEQARLLKPDVILTDIQMPKMNGLELIETVLKEMPDCKIVVLSCHQDYLYLRQAIQSENVVDYILKLSVEPEDLMKVMMKVAAVIDSEKKAKQEQARIKNQLESNMYTIRNAIFQQILSGDIGEDVLQQKIIEFLSELNRVEFSVLCLRFDSYNTIKPGMAGPLAQANYSYFDTIIHQNGLKGCTFSVKEGELALLLAFQEHDAESEERITGLCIKINQSLNDSFQITASFGIGNSVASLLETAQSYYSARAALAKRLFAGKSSISFYGNPNVLNSPRFFDEKCEKMLWNFLDREEFARAGHMIDEMLILMKGSKSCTETVIRAQLQEILDTFSAFAKNYHFRFRDLKDKNGDDPYHSMSKCENLDEILEWFREFIIRFSDTCQYGRPMLIKKEICSIMEYIEKNYSLDIKLRDMAKLVHLNETYLSSLFKNETGQYFADYVRRVRVNKAKEFIRKDGFSISEAAEKAGFESLSYFGKVFRQLEGMNPAEYRRRSRRASQE